MRVLAMSVLASLAPAVPAHALEVWQEADENGDPVVAVFALGNPPLSWLACTDAACVPAGGGATLSPGDTPAGTVFEVGLGAESARSSVWDGRIGLASPPVVSGEPLVGASVTSVAGTWTGG